MAGGENKSAKTDHVEVGFDLKTHRYGVAVIRAPSAASDAPANVEAPPPLEVVALRKAGWDLSAAAAGSGSRQIAVFGAVAGDDFSLIFARFRSFSLIFALYFLFADSGRSRYRPCGGLTSSLRSPTVPSVTGGVHKSEI